MRTLYFEIGCGMFTFGVFGFMGCTMIFCDGQFLAGVLFLILCILILAGIVLHWKTTVNALHHRQRKEIQAALDTQCPGLREAFCNICPKNQK